MTKIERVIKTLEKQRRTCHHLAKCFKDQGDKTQHDKEIVEAIAYSHVISMLTDVKYLNNIEKIWKDVE